MNTTDGTPGAGRARSATPGFNGEGSRPVNSPPAPDLIKVTEIFLVPSSFLVAALGTADTNPHRAAVSLLGLVVSGLWWVCSWEALAEAARPEGGAAGPAHPRRTRIMLWLPVIFTAGWLASLVGHVVLWGRPLGH